MAHLGLFRNGKHDRRPKYVTMFRQSWHYEKVGLFEPVVEQNSVLSAHLDYLVSGASIF